MKTGLVKRLLHGTFKKENKRNRISKKEDSWTNQLYLVWVWQLTQLAASFCHRIQIQKIPENPEKEF